MDYYFEMLMAKLLAMSQMLQLWQLMAKLMAMSQLLRLWKLIYVMK
jgi:hypothetical protein